MPADPSLQAYLASKYLSGPKADAILARTGDAERKKKKKRKKDAGGGGLVLKDDEDSWRQGGDEDDEEGVPVVDVSGPSKLKSTAVSSWKVVEEGNTPPPPSAQEDVPMDERPQVVVEEGDSAFAGRSLASLEAEAATAERGEGGQSSGAPTAPPPAKKRGGLMTKEEIAAEREARKAAEAAAAKAAAQAAAEASLEDPGEGGGPQGETVYRDSSGRKIDVKLERIEAARRKRERDEREQGRMEWGKGLVQRADKEREREEERRMRDAPFARSKDDPLMNAELRERERWNDPAAGFLTQKTSKGPARPKYTGPPPPPNRFGIQPGYRWDGVDRSNGFERKYFEIQNSRKRLREEMHAWGTEDM